MKILSSIIRIVVITTFLLTVLAAAFWFTIGRDAFGRPDFSLSAAALMEDFSRNEVAAGSKYLGKLVKVRGTYTTSGILGNSGWILLDGRLSLSGAQGVQCFLRKMDSAAHLKKGDVIQVRGKVLSKSLYVQLENCSVIY